MLPPPLSRWCVRETVVKGLSDDHTQAVDNSVSGQLRAAGRTGSSHNPSIRTQTRNQSLKVILDCSFKMETKTSAYIVPEVFNTCSCSDELYMNLWLRY